MPAKINSQGRDGCFPATACLSLPQLWRPCPIKIIPEEMFQTPTPNAYSRILTESLANQVGSLVNQVGSVPMYYLPVVILHRSKPDVALELQYN